MKQLVLLSIVCIGLAGVCPPDQTLFSGSCYHLIHTVMGWADAIVTCTAMGGDLAVAKTFLEHQFIWGIFKESNHTSGGVWVGCIRNGQDKWVDHRGTECKYFNWYWGEPNEGYLDEDCIEMRRQYYGQWNNIQCLHDNSVVCQHSAIQPITPRHSATQPIAPAMECLRANANGRFAPKM
ncbi:C-type lectin domain family 4 member M-like [Asterias amurensis]|uniref:C-type lectin domain family 4 member M-like n=1 Tax=Asterias amurensis TaxID=7602 RepID=UPI003AB752A8